MTYNLNGIRSALRKGFLKWLKSASPDILCLQETRAFPEQVDLTPIEALGYHHYWFPAEKKGYSGVAIFTRFPPDRINRGCGIDAYDREGRSIRADFGDVTILSVYTPSGTSETRHAFKMKWLAEFREYLDELRKDRPGLIFTGDLNICPEPKDIHDPISHARSSGFLPEERQWVKELLRNGFIDVFRHFDPSPHQYTWWSFRANARQKNLGWRIDHIFANRPLRERLLNAAIHPEAQHSDHCPVSLEFKL